MAPAGERGASSGSGCGPGEEPRKGELGPPAGCEGAAASQLLGKVTGMELLPSQGGWLSCFPAWEWWQGWIQDGGTWGWLRRLLGLSDISRRNREKGNWEP